MRGHIRKQSKQSWQITIDISIGHDRPEANERAISKHGKGSICSA